MRSRRGLVSSALLLLALGAMTIVAPSAAPAGAPGLVAAYAFEETSGASAADSSGTGNTGAISGAVSSASGKFGRALSFDGVNDIVSVADSSSLDLTTGMTLEAWVNPQGADWRTVLLKERPSGLAYALYSNTDTGRPSAEIRTSTPAETRGPAALPSGWSHLAATYDGATLRLYVNGTQVSSQARSGSIEVGTGAVRIGGNLVWGEYFNGLIDELRIYNRALTATEIQTDMTSPIAPTTDSQPPSAPGNLNATVNGDDVQLTWNASTDNTGVTGYRVYRSATAGFTPDAGTLIATIGAVTSYVDPDRVTGTWHYRVIAVDAAGNASATSAQASATIATAQPPSAPENLTAAVLSGDDVRLNWTASTGQAGVTSYRVYRNGTLIATRGAALPTAYDDVDVPPGTHGYTVLAVDPAGTSSAPSNEAGVTVQPDTTPPTVSVTDYGPPLCSRAVGDYVYLRPTISDDRGPVTFHLELDGATVFGPRTVLASDPLFSFTTFQEFWWDTRATPPGQHVMTAYARDGAGNEAASEPCVWTVGPLSVPITSPAAGVTVSGAVLVNAQPLAGDQIPNEIDIIGVGFSVDGVSKASDDTTPYQFSWDTTKVANGVHTLKVDLYWTDNPNRPSPSVASSTIQVTVANVVPKPTGLAATVETVDDVRLTWDAADGDIVDNFKLYRSATAGFTPGADNFVRLVDGGLTALTDADRPSGPWYYRLVAVGYGSGPANPPADASAPSDEAVATVEQDTSPPNVSFNHACDGSVSLVDQASISLAVSDDRGGSFLDVVSQGRTIWTFHNPWIQGPNVRIDWWTFPGWPDGLYDVDAIARDPSGNVTTATCTFRVDNPDFALDFVAPANGSTIAGDVTLKSLPQADGVPVAWPRVTYYIDGVSIGSGGNTPDDSLVWDSRTVANGAHTIKATFDWNGPIAATSTIQVTVRNPIPPPVGLVAAVTQDDVRLTWTASPANSVVTGYRVYRSTTSGFTPDAASLIATTTTPAYDDLNRSAGTYHYRVVAFSSDDASPPSAQVTANVNSLTGLVAAYGFEEASGTVALDSSGGGNAGTINGPTRTASGKYGRAVTFDGVNDLVTIADAASLDLTTGMTIEAWVWSSLGTNWRTVLIKERPGGLAYALYAATDTGRPGAFVDTNAESDTRGTANLQLQVWTHLAGTYDGTTLRFFVNGTLVSSRAVTGALRVSAGALQLGGNTIWSEWFKGRIDEVRIYNRALSAAEIALDRDTPVGAP